MYRTSIILRHTFREAVAQPIYALLLGLGAILLLIFSQLPFFTLSEDTVMFKSVGLDIILLLILIATLFATSKSIFEEIEDRTMLTLMSKPVKKWEVLLGKYLGIILCALLAAAILSLVLALSTWSRIPNDYLIASKSIDDRTVARLAGLRKLHLAGLFPELILKWLQISVLAAISVAISTRVSLVVNLPVVIFIYIAGNLTRFLFPLHPDDSIIRKTVAYLAGAILPYLQIFDLSQATVYKKIQVAQFAADPLAIPLSEIWLYVLIALLYAAAYATFALLAGLFLFQTRELGGAEG